MFSCSAVFLAGFGLAGEISRIAPTSQEQTTKPAGRIEKIDPPEKGFFSKRLDYEGIPIKAHADVSDAALFAARDRLAMQLEHLPSVRVNLHKAGAELHIIGINQVTSDLPEHRHLKGKPYEGKMTVDERTRGLGGLLTSCGEENLLKLPKKQDRYYGCDICVHEFAHNILEYGMPVSTRKLFAEQRKRSLAKGLWVDSYAGSKDHEYFAELSMWYFGTHGFEAMKGKPPRAGRDGLKEYDPEAFALFEKFYAGQLEPASATTKAAG